MADKKLTMPFSLTQATNYLETRSPQSANISDDMTSQETVIYAEVLRLHERMDSIENQATEMMSPEKMMEMAQGFLGGPL